MVAAFEFDNNNNVETFDYDFDPETGLDRINSLNRTIFRSRIKIEQIRNLQLIPDLDPIERHESIRNMEEFIENLLDTKEELEERLNIYLRD